MLSLVAILLVAATVSGSVVQYRPERKAADANFLKQQKQVLELFIGSSHNLNWDEEASKFDFNENLGSFTDEKYPKEFLKAYNRGLTPKNGIFSMFCDHTREDAIKLFDVFYFAKDLDTFLKAASWAKVHVNSGMFTFALYLALIHRSDTQSFVLPPSYEVLPNYFTPVDTLHRVYDDKMAGVKEGHYSYNSTGYEYNYHNSMFGDLLSTDNRGYGDFRISYFREDVGFNHFIAMVHLRRPTWMSPKKYNSPWLKRRGENFYEFLQQLLARYTNERTAAGIPNAEVLQWNKPIRVGYNPRVTYINGVNMYNRPDNMVPEYFNSRAVHWVQNLEKRIFDVIDSASVWDTSNNTLLPLSEEHGIELLGQLILGSTDRRNQFYQSTYFSGMRALAFMSSTATDRSFVGNAVSSLLTMARDPAYYNFVARIVKLFQHYKKTLKPYSHDAVDFPGVKVQKFEVDKFITYFDHFDYEVTNAVPMAQRGDYKDYRYMARQYRLNHKPYNYNISVESEKEADGIVRVFLGLKYDSDENLLSFEQARMTYVEIDRFPVKLAAGMNVFERNSKESPIFSKDPEGFRALYASINNAMSSQTPFYVSEYGQCGIPERFQLPLGWRGGRSARIAVVVNSYDRKSADQQQSYDIACGGGALYDGRPMGFPFDRPFNHELRVPNMYFKQVSIYHKEQTEVNRPAAS